MPMAGFKLQISVVIRDPLFQLRHNHRPKNINFIFLNWFDFISDERSMSKSSILVRFYFLRWVTLKQQQQQLQMFVQNETVRWIDGLAIVI